MLFTWYFPSLMALRKAQLSWTFKTHFKKSRLFWYLLNSGLFNSFKSWDFFCIDRIKNLSAMSDKACNLCSKIVQHYRMYTANGMGHLQLFRFFYKFTKVRSFHDNISSFLHEKASFFLYFTSWVPLNQIGIYSFSETQVRSESFKQVNKLQELCEAELSVFGSGNPFSKPDGILIAYLKRGEKLSEIINSVTNQQYSDFHCNI